MANVVSKSKMIYFQGVSKLYTTYRPGVKTLTFGFGTTSWYDATPPNNLNTTRHDANDRRWKVLAISKWLTIRAVDFASTILVSRRRGLLLGVGKTHCTN